MVERLSATSVSTTPTNSFLAQVTPILLVFNEEANLERSLSRLRWAREVVVIDSYSTDRSLEIARSFPNVRIVQHPFSSFADQWRFATSEAGVSTKWVLALDADYILIPEFVTEMANLQPTEGVGGFQTSFVYCVLGHPLRGTAYPPLVALYRRSEAVFREDGHTFRLKLNGRIEPLQNKILHDDRKPLSRWISAQSRYSEQESEKMLSGISPGGFVGKIRRTRFLGPLLMLFYCLILKGGIFDGCAGWFYAYQRTTAEMLLSLRLLENDLDPGRSNRE